jgi:hypothetical protein
LSTVGEVVLEVILNSLYSIFTNALKQARQIQRDDCDEVYDEDGTTILHKCIITTWRLDLRN